FLTGRRSLCRTRAPQRLVWFSLCCESCLVRGTTNHCAARGRSDDARHLVGSAHRRALVDSAARVFSMTGKARLAQPTYPKTQFRAKLGPNETSCKQQRSRL